MTEGRRPGYVVFRELDRGCWKLVGEVDRRPGLSARAARAEAVSAATGGKTKPGETYAAVLRGEWRIALDW